MGHFVTRPLAEPNGRTRRSPITTGARPDRWPNGTAPPSQAGGGHRHGFYTESVTGLPGPRRSDRRGPPSIRKESFFPPGAEPKGMGPAGSGGPGPPPVENHGGWLQSAWRRLSRARSSGPPGLAVPRGAPGEAPPPGPVAGPATAASPTTPPGPPPLPGSSRKPPAPGPGSCPECRVPYLPTGPTGRFSCPMCGHHAAGPPPASRTTAGTADPRPREELLAAWMLGRPMPCPRCRRPLRRDRPTDFSCPACGDRVHLPELGASGDRRPEQGSVADRPGHPFDLPPEGPVLGEGRH